VKLLWSICHGDSLPEPILGEQERRTSCDPSSRNQAFSQIHSFGAGKVRNRGFAIVIAAILTSGSGCAGNKLFNNDSNNMAPAGVPSAPLSSLAQSNSNQVVQASATTSTGPTNSSFSMFSGMNDKTSKQTPVEIALGWRHWVDYLPDPTRNGVSGPGLAGQMFLFGPRMQNVEADGTLTVELYDETPYPPGHPGNIPERWVFTKDALKKLRSVDERFGKCYVLFLPWPTYRPDVTRVRIVSHFDVDGKRLIPEEAKFTIGTSPNNSTPLMPNDSPYESQGLQSLLGLSASGAGSPTNLGMGSLSPGEFTPNGLNAGSMPLGVIGSLPSGATASNRPASNLPGAASAMPITGTPMTNMQLPNMQSSATNSNMTGAFQAPSGPMSPPSSFNGGLIPVGGSPQGLPPLAFTANPLGH
jgi:hypothetical protein